MLTQSSGSVPAVVAQISGGIAVVRLSGELDITVRAALAGQLALVAGKKPDLMMIDLAGVPFMDCGTAAMMLQIAGQLPSGRNPVLRSACPLVRRMLQLTGLDAHCELAG